MNPRSRDAAVQTIPPGRPPVPVPGACSRCGESVSDATTPGGAASDIFESLVSRTDTQLVYLDPSFVFVEVNEAYARGCGMPREALIGRNHFDLFPNDENRRIFEEVAATGREWRAVARPFEFAGQPERGVTYWDWRLSPVADPGGAVQGLVLSLVDVTRRTRSEHLLRAISAIFVAASEARSLMELMESAVDEVRRLTGVEAVGLRLLEADGRIPYTAYAGFSPEFYELESPLSIHSDRYMCINVVRGDTDPALPFYTQAGSFIMNTTTTFLATVSEAEKGASRNVCNRVGYESVAVVPIRDHGRIIGLVHLADPREWRVPPPLVDELEHLGLVLGEAIRRTQIEVALREQREKLAVLFDLMPVGISILDRDRRVIISNPALSRILRLPLEAIRADEHLRRRHVAPDGALFDPDELPSARAMAEGRPVEDVEIEVELEDGERRWTAVSAIPLPFDDWRIGIVTTDVTERKRSEAALARQADELARSNRELERFAYVASHDLQEPIRSIVSFSQLVERRYRGGLDTDADEYLAFIVEGGLRMQALIRDLLAFSRIGTHGKSFEPTDAAVVVKDVLRDHRDAIAEGEAAVTVGPLPTVMADPGQLSQVFANLIGNAIKYRHPDRAPAIRIEAEADGDMWRFAVADNGIGIEGEYFERVFEIFRRLHTKDAYPGTGVGLAIVQKVVERHGGTIGIASTPGEGSTFSFTLKAA